MFTNEGTRNRLAILKALRQAEGLSRRELADKTGLSGATVTLATSDLLQRGLIREDAPHATGKQRGRPRTRLFIDADRSLVVGGVVGAAGTFDSVVANLAGEQVLKVSSRIRRSRTLPDLASTFAECLAEAIGKLPADHAPIAHVGVGIPGIVDSIRGDVHFLATFEPGPAPFAGTISERLGLPVTIENTVVSMARAEHWFGHAQNLNSFTLINAGHVVGSARYLHGLPHLGPTGLNSEFGHSKFAHGPDARLCYCGGRGCLTAYSSIIGILQQADLMDAPPPKVARRDVDARLAQLIERAKNGDNSAMSLFDEAGRHLGMAVANHVNAANPGNVLIVAPNAPFRDAIAGPFQAALEASAFPALLDLNTVRFEVRTEDWRRKGAAALALEQSYLGEDRQSAR